MNPTRRLGLALAVLLAAACAPAARRVKLRGGAARPAATVGPARPPTPCPPRRPRAGQVRRRRASPTSRPRAAASPPRPGRMGAAQGGRAARGQGRGPRARLPGLPQRDRGGLPEGPRDHRRVHRRYRRRGRTRVDRESRAGNVTVDVYVGGTPSGWTMAERGQVDDVVPLLVDPEIVNPAVWRGGALRLTPPSDACRRTSTAACRPPSG